MKSERMDVNVESKGKGKGKSRGTIIEVRRLSYTYPDGTQALREVSLQVEEGESVGLIGPNGAGKSTLLLHLNGLLMGSGEVQVMGEVVSDGNLKQVRQVVGLVFQDPDDQLFMPTVFEDVAFGPNNLRLSAEEVQQRVAWALERVGMVGMERRSPHRLSLGEKKRIAIATVLTMRPKVLALDEPTANLDPRSRRNLLRLLPSLGLTQIIATHDLEAVAELCQRVVLLDGGRVVAEGETHAILTDGQLMQRHGLEVPASLRG